MMTNNSLHIYLTQYWLVHKCSASIFPRSVLWSGNNFMHWQGGGGRLARLPFDAKCRQQIVAPCGALFSAIKWAWHLVLRFRSVCRPFRVDAVCGRDSSACWSYLIVAAANRLQLHLDWLLGIVNSTIPTAFSMHRYIDRSSLMFWCGSANRLR